MDIKHIKFYKWNKEDFAILKKSINENIRVKELQSYNPIYALYFYYHNTPNSHKIIDINRRYFIREIEDMSEISDINNNYFNCNKILSGKVWDNEKKELLNKELFVKISPILDPITYIMNNYNIHPKRNSLLPSNYNYNTSQKINNMNNTCYIDSFMTYIGNTLQENNKLPCFAQFYGGFSGIIDNYSHDITEEYHSFKKRELV